METPPKCNPLPRVIALVLVTLVIAWLLHRFYSNASRRLETMSAVDNQEYMRRVYGHSYFFHFVIALIFGGFYVGAVDTVTWLIRALMPKNANQGQ